MNANTQQMTAASEAYWDLHSIIGQLRAVRDHSLAARQRLGKPVKLPSRKSLASIVEKLSIALFPNRLSARQLSDDTIDYFVGHTLDGALRELLEQVQQELQFNAADNSSLEVLHAPALNIVRRFSEQLPKIRQLLDSDIQAAYEGDPAARSIDEVLGCYPGITAVIQAKVRCEDFDGGSGI